MKKTNIHKLVFAAVLVALAVVGSLISFPIGASKCAPVQHLVNIIGAVFLGPAWAVGVGFTAALLRNLLGLGSLLAFPGSMVGAFVAGMLYKYIKKLPVAYVGELFGTSVLGADDKAGIAEIMTIIEHLNDNTIPHGPLCIAFTPDEEIGMGPAHFDIKKFGADFAYTLDGDTEGEIQYENFNAARAVVEFTGVNVHPGSSKNTMVNAALVAMEFNSMLPSADTPRDTEDYEGFFHLYSIKGDVSHAALEYIIRDHNATTFDVRKKTMKHITKILNEKWGKGTVSLTITEQYRNMKEIIDTCMELIEHATAACKECNIPPLITPIRGGTDGAQLSFMGLPCPNLGTGGHAYHGPYEHITVEGMNIAVDVGLKIIELFYK